MQYFILYRYRSIIGARPKIKIYCKNYKLTKLHNIAIYPILPKKIMHFLKPYVLMQSLDKISYKKLLEIKKNKISEDDILKNLILKYGNLFNIGPLNKKKSIIEQIINYEK